MTRVLAGALLLLLLPVPADAAIYGAVANGPARKLPVYFLRVGERLTLSWNNDARTNAVAWFQIEPELRAYDNRPGEHQPLSAIHYRRRTLTSAPLAQLVLTFQTPGTRYFSAGAVVPPRFSDVEPIHRRHLGIVQVVVRSGDRYEDFLGELLGTPFIMGPAATTSGWHQTDQRVASDCAAFATYGRRRMGYAVPYAGPVGIVKLLQPIRGTPFFTSADGVYRDPAGRSLHTGLSGVRPGDIVHFGPQVAVFHADRGRRGTLDANDLLFQSWRTTPHVTTIRDSGFFRFPLRVFRWR